MMVGELDYTDLLVENTVNNHTVPGTGVPYVPLPILTFLLFVLFILMVSVVLVNLLVSKIFAKYNISFRRRFKTYEPLSKANKLTRLCELLP